MKKFIFVVLAAGCINTVSASDEGKTSKEHEYRVVQNTTDKGGKPKKMPLAKEFLNLEEPERYGAVKNIVNGLSRKDQEKLLADLQFDLENAYNGCTKKPCDGCKEELPYDKAARRHYFPGFHEQAYAKLTAWWSGKK